MTRERRESFRCRSGGDELPPKGVLHTRRGDVTVKLTNRSSGGFGVLLPAGNRNQFNEHEEISFTVGDSSSLVRVAHQSESPDGVLLGLEIVRELSTQLDQSFCNRTQTDASSGKLLRYTMLAACAVLIAYHVPWSEALSVFKSGELPEKIVAEVRHGSESLFAPREEQSNQVKLANQFIQLDQLTSRQAVTRLNLSNTQQREIGSIVKETTYSMEILFENRESITDAEWATLGLSLLQNSARRIEGTLNEQQRAEWANLMRGASTDRGATGS